MLNTYDNFTLNSIFWPMAFIKKKHALQYQLQCLCSTILFYKDAQMSIETSTKWRNRDYAVDIEVHVFLDKDLWPKY